jgi:TonB family protein
MTFRHSFYISIAAHMMAFGSALAIAQYAGGRLLSSGDAMMVALISPGQTSGNGKGSIARQKRLATSETIHHDPKPKEIPADVHAPDPGTESMKPSGPIQETGTAGTDAGTMANSEGAGQGASAQFGVMSPEWANLAAAIERTKYYPRLARERGIEGVVRVRFRLTSSGAVEKIEIVESSGSEILDKAAVDAANRATWPRLSGWVTMPMNYSLK